MFERYMAVDTAQLTDLIEPEARALGFDLVRVGFVGGADEPTLQVMAERPDTRQLNIDDCAALSRRISDRFDALEEAGDDPVPHAYRLEVSSPGIDRPLTRPADFADWAGHEVRVNVKEAVAGRKQLRGELAGIDGEMIAIDDLKSGRQTFAFGNIHSAKLVLTDKLIAETQPVSAEGADDIETIESNDTEEQEE